jgi:hypothetical protein
MNCPKCADYESNAERYAIETLSTEIAVQANTTAMKATATQSENFIDYYMLHYRIEFTRCLNEKKQIAKESYNTVLDNKYVGHPDLCSLCKTDANIFDQPLSFCFHEGDYDATCDRCIKKTDKN